MNIRYTLPALANVDSILTYISTTSPKGAARVQKRIQDVIGLLLTHPEIGLRTDDPDVRRSTTTPYPFLVFYEIGSQEIIIHAIRHGARDPGGMPGKHGSSSHSP
ncbi:type II toxin-antitoxin system RelE/ParE family toxin [Frankia sp. RB7]|nr:type II toxin-antitoxin system RelE/ParE family toxin [Frankia sp. RB7]